MTNSLEDAQSQKGRILVRVIKYFLILSAIAASVYFAGPYIGDILAQVLKYIPIVIFVLLSFLFAKTMTTANADRKKLTIIYILILISYFTAAPHDSFFVMGIAFALITLVYAIKAFKHFLMVGAGLFIYSLVAPVVHPFIFESIKFMPTAVFALLTFLFASLAYQHKSEKKKSMLWSVLAVAAPILAVGSYFTNTHPMIIEWQLGTAVNPEELSSLPYTVNSRILARSTAQMYLENATKDSRVKVGQPHLALTKTRDGGRRLVWRAGLEGDVYYYKWLDSVTGVVSLDAGQTQQVIAENEVGDKAFFLMGHKSPVVDAILKSRHPLSKRGSTIYWQKDNGEWVFLVSYWSYRPTATLTMVPYLAGVMEFSNMGMFWSHSADSAAEKFAGASLYPTDLMELYGDAYAKFHDGLWNFYVAQKDILEVAEESSQGDSQKNQFPFFQEFKELGLQLVLPFEPYGKGRSALQRILFFDAITGKAKVYIVGEGRDNELSSPRIAITTADNAAPDAMWNTYDIEDPVLSHDESGTYWLLKVVKKNKSNPASVFIVLVKADQPHALTAIAFKTREELEQFTTSKSVAMKKLMEATKKTDSGGESN